MNGNHGKRDLAGLQPEFNTALGLYHGVFAAFDLLTDYAIFKFLNVTPHQAHLLPQE